MVKLKSLRLPRREFRGIWSLKRKLEVSLARINSLDKRRKFVKEDLKEISISKHLGKLRQSLSNRVSVKKDLSRCPLITL